MDDVSSLQLVSTLGEDGRLIVELATEQVAAPTGTQLLVRIEAAPINPSDLGLLFGPADLSAATFEAGRITAPVPAAALRMMAARIGVPMAVGNEGAGTVIAAGDAPEAQALIGKRVSCATGGGMYAQYKLVDMGQCLSLPEGATAQDGASSFVNPMTALGFVETLRRSSHKGIVHTAAASNLGQMLVRICREDGIPLVNIVRSEAQVALLKALGAVHVVDSSSDSFDEDLAAALDETKATMSFDAIGGGSLTSRILTAMERVASKGAAYSRYGSNNAKQAYIYGSLDTAPTILTRSFGFSWSISGWLLTPFLASIGETDAERLRQRVRDHLTTTFASRYKAAISLQEALSRDAALAYKTAKTGEKYLILPHGV